MCVVIHDARHDYLARGIDDLRGGRVVEVPDLDDSAVANSDVYFPCLAAGAVNDEA